MKTEPMEKAEDLSDQGASQRKNEEQTFGKYHILDRGAKKTEKELSERKRGGQLCSSIRLLI